MEHKEDIGKLIKDRLQGGQKSPSDGLWSKIDITLEKRKKRRGLILILSVLLVFIGLTSILYFNFKPSHLSPENSETNSQTIPKITPSETTESHLDNFSNNDKFDEDQSLKIIPDDTTPDDNKVLTHQNRPIKTSTTAGATENKISNISSQEKVNPSIAVNDKNSEIKTHISTEEGLEKDNNQNKTFNDEIEKPMVVNDSLTKPSSENELTAKENEERQEEDKEEESQFAQSDIEEKNSRLWSLTIHGGPATQGAFGSSSLIDPRLDNNKRKGTVDFSYGFAFRFDLSQRTALSYGVNISTFSYLTQDIPSSNESEINRILSFTKIGAGNTISSSELTNFLQGEPQTQLLQKIEYFELPLVIRYNFSDNRFGLQTLGGLSTYLLKKEGLYVQNKNGNTLKIGSSNGLIETRFSLNGGVGAYYRFSDYLIIEISPTVKYNLSKISDWASGDNPFTFEIITGLTYKFF